MRRIIIIIIIRIDKIIVILIRKNRKLCRMDKEYILLALNYDFFLYSIFNYLNKTIISLDRKSFIIIIIGVIWVKMWDFIDE